MTTTLEYPQMTNSSNSPAETLQILNTHFVCFAVTLKSWTGRRMLKGAQVELRGEKLTADKTTAPQAQLMPKYWRERFQEIASRKSLLLRSHTLPYLTTGFACVRSTQAAKFLVKLTELRNDLLGLRERFKNRYEADVIQWNKDRWSSNYELVAKDIPQRDAVNSLFDLTWANFRIETGTDPLDVHELDHETLEEILKQTREMTQSRVHAMVETLVKEPRERIAEAVKRLHELIQRDGHVTSASFNQLRVAAQLLKEFSDLPALSDSTLTARLQDVEQFIDRLPKRRGQDGQELQSFDLSGDTRNGLTTTLDAVIQTCSDTEAAAEMVDRFGRLGRGMILD